MVLQEPIATHLDRILDVAAVVVPLFLGAMAVGLRWLGRIEVTVGLQKQIVTQHLPFVYGRLRVHDEALKLDSPEHPNIGFVPNGK